MKAIAVACVVFLVITIGLSKIQTHEQDKTARHLIEECNHWQVEATKWKFLATSKQGWLKIDKTNFEQIIEWVMKKSSRISHREAYQIVSWCDDKKLCFVLLSLIQVESSFNPTKVSHTGAIGMGQIMPLWIPELKEQRFIEEKRDLFDPFLNITCTEYILKKYLKEGNLKQALIRYRGKHSKSYLRAIYANLGELFVIMGGIDGNS